MAGIEDEFGKAGDEGMGSEGGGFGGQNKPLGRRRNDWGRSWCNAGADSELWRGFHLAFPNVSPLRTFCDFIPSRGPVLAHLEQ